MMTNLKIRTKAFAATSARNGGEGSHPQRPHSTQSKSPSGSKEIRNQKVGTIALAGKE
jgi:hypothetical protein